jgi:hypothetical protein
LHIGGLKDLPPEQAMKIPDPDWWPRGTSIAAESFSSALSVDFIMLPNNVRGPQQIAS